MCLCGKLKFVNAGLRGHQFVKEGAEEVLESGDFPLGHFDFCFERDERLSDGLLLFNR
jgi:hypothetical protein